MGGGEGWPRARDFSADLHDADLRELSGRLPDSRPLPPPMPSESDRKRIVGCLAGVLSSMYDWDQWIEEDGEDDLGKDGDLGFSAPTTADVLVGGGGDSVGSGRDGARDGPQGSNGDENKTFSSVPSIEVDDVVADAAVYQRAMELTRDFSSAVYSDDEEDDLYSDDENPGEDLSAPKSDGMRRVKSAPLDRALREALKKAEADAKIGVGIASAPNSGNLSSDVSTAFAPAANEARGKTEEGKVYGAQYSFGDVVSAPSPQPKAGRPFLMRKNAGQQPPHQPSRRAASARGLRRGAIGKGKPDQQPGDSGVKRNRGRKRHKHTAALALERHRRRRHSVYSELLLGAADLLDLDEWHARAFLPMLGRLEKPERKSPGDREKEERKGQSKEMDKSRKGDSRVTTATPAAAPDPAAQLFSQQSQKNSSSEKEVLPWAGGVTVGGRSKALTVGTARRSKGDVRVGEASPTLRDECSATAGRSDKEAAHYGGSDGGGDGANQSSGGYDDMIGAIELPEVRDGDFASRPTSLSLLTLSSESVEEDADEVEEGESDNLKDKCAADGQESEKRDKTISDELGDDSDDDEDEAMPLIRPFLEGLTPGAGFQCLSLLLLRHLLRSRKGYDARVRHAFKKLAVAVISHEMTTEGFRAQDVCRSGYSGGNPGKDGVQNRSRRRQILREKLVAIATRKFEALERATASKLIRLSSQQQQQQKILKQQQQQQQQQKEERVMRQGQEQQQIRAQQQPQQGPDKRRGNNQTATQPQQKQRSRAIVPAESEPTPPDRYSVTREQVMRGLKVGSAGLAAGAIFALTGGLAAPGIAAGVAAMTASIPATVVGAATMAAVATALTSTVAVTTIFGVGGGGLAAYKMQRRTKGLTEFCFQRETGRSGLHRKVRGRVTRDSSDDAELFSTVCISGWLRDSRDFQRPWGVQPTNPPIHDRLELLERFYYVMQPSKVSRCSRVLHHWKGEERELWRMLGQKYGRDPDRILPFNGPRHQASLTHEEHMVINRLLEELGYIVTPTQMEEPQQRSGRFGRIGEAMRNRLSGSDNVRDITTSTERKSWNSLQRTPKEPDRSALNRQTLLLPEKNGRQGKNMPVPLQPGVMSSPSTPFTSALSLAESVPDLLVDLRREGVMPVAQTRLINDAREQQQQKQHTEQKTRLNSQQQQQQQPDSTEESELPRHLATVWDYSAEYGGELYTVKWESHLLLELCDSVTDMAVDLLGAGTKELLKQTALASLVVALAIPYALTQFVNGIDGSWTMAIERSDDAGIELAKSLLESQAGHRPVTLVAYSMGSRTVYSCLKELARHQELWEDQQMEKRKRGGPVTEEPSANKDKNEQEKEMEYAREPASIIEDVILMGMPNHLSLVSWQACRRIIAGRFIHCYSRKDLILSLMFQYKRLTRAFLPVCGTCAINLPGVENYDVTNLVSSHADYCLMTGEILRLVRHGQPRPLHPTEVAEKDGSKKGTARQDAEDVSMTLTGEINNFQAKA